MESIFLLSNLLSEVSQGSVLKAKYYYAADGTKLGVKDNANNGYYYRGSLIYSRSGNISTWESVGFSDGRIQKTTSGINVNYHLTDHLGSVRAIFNQDGTLIAQNSYYPFGGRHDDATSLQSVGNRFLYNGKEEQTTGDIDYLDYGARMYDDVLGRWFVIDPQAEKYLNISPYAYCANDPILFIDPNGEEIRITIDGNNISIMLTAKIYNDTGIDLGDKYMKEFLDMFKSSIESIWSGKFGDYNVTTDVEVEIITDLSQANDSDHIVYLLSGMEMAELGASSSSTPAIAVLSGTIIMINHNAYNDKMINKNFDRTFAHELGHSLSLEHPAEGTMPGNLMHQSTKDDGTKLEKSQFDHIKKNVSKLNNGSNKLDRFKNKKQ